MNEERHSHNKEDFSIESLLEEIAEIPIHPQIIEWMTSWLTTPNIKHVLSLGGGGAKGLVGNFIVICLLDKLGLLDKFDEIWGVSAGAIIGGAYCSGSSTLDLLNLLTNIHFRDYFEISFGGIMDGSGFLKSSKLHEFFIDYFHNSQIEQCRKPFFALAVEYNGQREHVAIFKNGSLADAILASMSVPDVFQPVDIEGRSFVDGGLIENTASISIAEGFQQENEEHHLSIFGTGFGEEHFNPTHRTLLKKATNLLGVYRYQLQLDQVLRVQSLPNCHMILVNFEIGINRTDFSHIGRQIIPTYHEFLKKLEKIAQSDSFNGIY